MMGTSCETIVAFVSRLDNLNNSTFNIDTICSFRSLLCSPQRCTECKWYGGSSKI